MIEMIDERCSIEETDEKLSIVIEGTMERKHETMLFAWLILWLILGVVAFRELIYGGVSANGEAYSPAIFLAIKIYLVFWTYFLFKIGRAFLWSRGGKELILLKDNTLFVKKAIYGYGRSREFPIENISTPEILAKTDMSFQDQMESSFWVVGGEKILFDSFGKRFGFGRKINDGLAKTILKRVNKRLKMIKKAADSVEAESD